MRYGVIAKTRAYRARRRGHPVDTANQKPPSRTNAADTRFASSGSNAFDSRLMVTPADVIDESAVARAKRSAPDTARAAPAAANALTDLGYRHRGS
jgi:hypothetical protein